MMEPTLLMVTVVLIVTACFVFYKRRKQQQTVLADMGLTGPQPHWFMGSMWDRMTCKLYQNLIEKWTAKYGKTFGYYEGSTAVVVTADVDIVREVFVKQFHNFNAHKRLPLQPGQDNEFAHMFLLQGPKWKRVRSICNPSFSTGKIKWMTSSALTKKLDTLVEVCRESKGKQVDVVHIFQALMLDIILDVAFGVSVDAQKNPDVDLLKRTRAMFEGMSKTPLMGHISTLLPFISHILFFIAYAISLVPILRGGTPFDGALELTKVLEDVVNERINNPSDNKRLDLTQSLIDAEIEDEHSDAGVKRKLGKVEIVSNGLLFLMAGYETTSSTLAFAAYLLATNPDKQEKLQDEIDNHTGDDDDISYTCLTKMVYLEMVICETLRMYPIGGLVANRECNEDTVVNGLKFNKGVCLQANVWAIHNDLELWGPEDTSLFVPERFSADRKSARHPMAWMPFGAGPRACIGQRMAMIEAKMSLARVLKEFTFVKCDKTADPPEVRDVTIVTNPVNGMFLEIIPRDLKA